MKFIAILFSIFSLNCFAESCLSTLAKDVPSLVPKDVKLEDILKSKNPEKEIGIWILTYEGDPELIKELADEQKDLANTVAQMKKSKAAKLGNEIFAHNENIKSMKYGINLSNKKFADWLKKCASAKESNKGLKKVAEEKLKSLNGQNIQLSPAPPAAQ